MSEVKKDIKEVLEAVESETGKVTFSRITELRKEDYQWLTRSIGYRGREAISRIKEIILGISKQGDTQEVYMWGSINSLKFLFL